MHAIIHAHAHINNEPRMSTQRYEVEPGIELNIVIDDCTDPWDSAETILMVHGLAESGEAWRGWVPHLCRKYRVARVDLRGFEIGRAHV